LIESWLAETGRERRNAHATVAFLVTQRRGVGATNAHRWWAWWYLADLEQLREHPAPRPVGDGTPIRMRLDDALHLIRTAGYGQPSNEETAA
ncbi:MAG: hypothetical protein K0R97_2860, partial [Oerskovia sp.]|nr:hypothetical protein [Oerskovia sp.]